MFSVTEVLVSPGFCSYFSSILPPVFFRPLNIYTRRLGDAIHFAQIISFSKDILKSMQASTSVANVNCFCS